MKFRAKIFIEENGIRTAFKLLIKRIFWPNCRPHSLQLSLTRSENLSFVGLKIKRQFKRDVCRRVGFGCQVNSTPKLMHMIPKIQTKCINSKSESIFRISLVIFKIFAEKANPATQKRACMIRPGIFLARFHLANLWKVGVEILC